MQQLKFNNNGVVAPIVLYENDKGAHKARVRVTFFVFTHFDANQHSVHPAFGISIKYFISVLIIIITYTHFRFHHIDGVDFVLDSHISHAFNTSVKVLEKRK